MQPPPAQILTSDRSSRLYKLVLRIMRVRLLWETQVHQLQHAKEGTRCDMWWFGAVRGGERWWQDKEAYLTTT